MPVPPAAVLPSGCDVRRDRLFAGDPDEVCATLAKASSAAIPARPGAQSPAKPWSGGYAAYRSPKAALTVFYAHTLADDGIKVNALAPGVVQQRDCPGR